MQCEASVNPLRPYALTADTVRTGDHIACWRVTDDKPARYLTVLGTPYTNDNGDRVIEVRDHIGHETEELTSELGLSGARHDGKWYAIAIRMDPESEG